MTIFHLYLDENSLFIVLHINTTIIEFFRDTQGLALGCVDWNVFMM